MFSDKNSNRTRNIRIVLSLVLVIILFLSGCGTKPKVVGILSGLNGLTGLVEGFKAEMTKLGYIEGKNIIYDLRKLNNDTAAEQEFAQKLVAKKVDLIYVFPTAPTMAAKEAVQGTKIPVVFANVIIEVVNLVKSVREPGGNITGVRSPGMDQVVKSLEILHEIAPRVKRLFIPYEQGYPNCPFALKALRPIALESGVTLVEVPVNSVAEIQTNLQALSKSVNPGTDAIQMMPDRLTESTAAWALITKFAVEHKIPIVGRHLPSADHGAIFAYASDPYEVGTLAASLADKIFKGAPAGKIPVVTPEARLRVNYKLARELGLTVSEDLLSQAYEVIQ